MAIGDQAQQVASMGLDQLNNVMLKNKISDKRKRNEMLRLGQQDPTAFAVQNTQALQQPEQPTEFLGAGRIEYQPGTIDESLLGALGGTTQRTDTGQNFYYSGNYDLTKARWGTQDKDDLDLGGGKYNIMDGGQSLGTGYKSLADSIKDLQRQKYSVSPAQQWQAAQPLYKSAGYSWNGDTWGEQQTLDQAAMDAAGIRQNPNWRAAQFSDEYGKPLYLDNSYDVNTPQYQKAVSGYTVRNGDFFTSEDAAKQAIEKYAGEYITGNNTRDWETLGQLLNYGSVTGDFSTPHAIGGNQKADPIKGLDTLYGSKPIIYDGKLLGYSGDISVDPIKDQWNKQWQNTSTSGNIFKKTTTTDYGWDVGALGMGRNLVDPNWYMQNATINGNKYLLAPDKAASNPGWTNEDYFARDAGGGSYKKSTFMGPVNNFMEKVAKFTDPIFYKSMGGGTDKSLWKDMTNEGLFSAVFNKLDPVLDKVDPLHNPTQDAVTGLTNSDSQKEAFNKVAPIVLAALTWGLGSGASAGAAAAGEGAAAGGAGAAAGTAGAAAGGAGLNTLGQILSGVQAAQNLSTGNFAGAALSGLGAANINPTSALTSYLKDAGMPAMAARAIPAFATSATTNLLRGQDTKSALASALFSTAGGEAGNYLTKATEGVLGNVGSKIFGGAVSGAISNPKSAIESAIASGAVGGLSGMFTPSNATQEQRQIANNKAKTAVNLAKLFVKRK